MFSTTCKYAIRAVLYLATKSDKDNKIGVDIISEDLDVPKHFLAKILQQLTRNKLISSSKGRSGGFYLSDENKESDLIEVIRSFDGPGTFEDCVLGLKECSNVNPCPYHHTVQLYRNKFFLQLKEETVADTATRIETFNFKLNN